VAVIHGVTIRLVMIDASERHITVKGR
jgi:hypothetical protein